MVLMLTARDAIENRVEGWRAARMITWSSLLPPLSWWRACMLCCAVSKQSLRTSGDLCRRLAGSGDARG